MIFLYFNVDPATITSDIVVEVVDTMYQFTVEASGTSPLLFTWYINNIMSSNEPTLTVPMNFTEGHTEVRVQVTNYDEGVAFSDDSALVIYVQNVPVTVTIGKYVPMYYTCGIILP